MDYSCAEENINNPETTPNPGSGGAGILITLLSIIGLGIGIFIFTRKDVSKAILEKVKSVRSRIIRKQILPDEEEK